MDESTSIEWRPVVGYEGIYSVSDDGRVYSHKRGIELVQTERHGGHFAVNLSRNGAPKPFLVHRLVLIAFVGHSPDANATMCLHNDGDPKNNKLSNLRWGTPKENAADSRRHNTHFQGKKTHCLRGHPFDVWNTIWKSDGCRSCRTCKNLRQRRSRAAGGSGSWAWSKSPRNAYHATNR